ncbi:MAG: hypothetical protein ACYTF7_11520 [Planctomycetota bacterium]|jgi:hypothetical protein
MSRLESLLNPHRLGTIPANPRWWLGLVVQSLGYVGALGVAGITFAMNPPGGWLIILPSPFVLNAISARYAGKFYNTGAQCRLSGLLSAAPIWLLTIVVVVLAGRGIEVLIVFVLGAGGGAIMYYLVGAIAYKCMRKRPRDETLCPECGYALAELDGDVCPECGETLP